MIDFNQIGTSGKQENKINKICHSRVYMPIQDVLIILCCIAVEVWRGMEGSGGK